VTGMGIVPKSSWGRVTVTSLLCFGQAGLGWAALSAQSSDQSKSGQMGICPLLPIPSTFYPEGLGAATFTAPGMTSVSRGLKISLEPKTFIS
jgi:hypothetical protein